MEKLNLPEFNLILKEENNTIFIFDEIRKKYIILTPEEWVRQNFLKYLITYKNYPAGLISIEKTIIINNISKRYDTLIYNRKGVPRMIIEFKAPKVNLNQKMLEQVLTYNYDLRVEYIMLTNGIKHYCLNYNYLTGEINYLNFIPDFSAIDN